MKLTYLGSGNAFAPQRSWSSILVDDTMLLDAGPALLLSMKRLSLDPAQIRHIFISHLHADHYFGLTFLLLDNYFLSRTDAPLAIIGPPGIESHLHQLMTLAYPEVIARGWPRPMTFVEAAANETQTVNGLTFTSIPVEHVPGILTPFGYRLHLPDGVLAFSGDTCMTDTLYSLIDGAKVSILEASAQEESAVHLGLADIRRLLERVPEDSVVLLNHLDTPDAAAWQGMRVIVPQDLQTLYFQFSAQAAKDAPSCR